MLQPERAYPRQRARYGLILLLSWLLLLSGCQPFSKPAAISARLTVAVLDVGQGLSVAAVTDDGHALLYDAGNGATDVQNVILPFLRQHGVQRLDYLVVSHPDQDHVGGIPAVLSAIPIGLFLDPVLPTTNHAYLQALQLVASKQIPAQRARRGQNLTLGQVRVEVLWPRDPLMQQDGAVSDNDNAVVIRLVLGDIAVLLPADIEAPAESALVAAGAGALRANVLVVPHHGSRTSSTTPFLAAVAPKFAIISAGAHNAYGHPHPEAIARLRAAGATIFRTDQDGTVTVLTDGQSIQVKTERGKP